MEQGKAEPFTGLCLQLHGTQLLHRHVRMRNWGRKRHVQLVQIARWQAGLRPVQGNRLKITVAMGAAKRMKLFAAANDGEEEEDQADGQEDAAPAAHSANADASSERSSQLQERRFRGQRIETPSRPGAPCLQLAPVVLRAHR